MRETHLPWSKALAGYAHIGRIDAQSWQELEGLARPTAWLQRGKNMLLFNPYGVAKTPIGIALALINLDQPCRFQPAPPWQRLS